jgi:hypothetical protein
MNANQRLVFMISALAEDVRDPSADAAALCTENMNEKRGPVDPGPLFCLLLGLSWR